MCPAAPARQSPSRRERLMGFETIILNIERGLATIALNRPRS